MRLPWIRATCTLLCFASAGFAQTVGSVALGPPLVTMADPFSRVAAVREEPDGQVLVLDRIENRIVRVNLLSASITPIGRLGQGPGEFTLPLNLLALAADTTLAPDMAGGGRALVVTARGARPERVSAAGFPAGAPLFYRPDIQADTQGRLYELVQLVGVAGSPPGFHGVRRLDRASGRADTIASVSQLMQSSLAPRPARAAAGSRTSAASVGARAGGPAPPFASVDQWAVAQDGRVAIVTVDPYRVQFVGPDGAKTEGPVLDFVRVPVTSALKEEWREHMEQPVASLQYGPGGAMTAGHVRRTYREPAEWPDVLPPFLDRALRFAPDGMLWVARAGPAASGQQFDVVDTRGRVALRVAFPPRVRLVGFGARGIYTVRLDQDDLEFLQLHAPLP